MYQTYSVIILYIKEYITLFL